MYTVPSTKQLSSPLKSNTITYRNAVYEGGIDQQNQTRKDFGIIYVAKTHQFIVCNNWHHDYLEGECIFYNGDRNYVYGMWINNLPQGFNVFAIHDILFMAEFNRGRLTLHTRVLVIFEKYNIGAILIVSNDSNSLDDLEFQIFTKKQVFTSEDAKELFLLCEWPQEYFIDNQTLIKYISKKFTKNVGKKQSKHHLQNQCKLRLIQNKYYRFGYDEGLAIVFDQDFNRISVGYHLKSKLKSFGMVFERPQNFNKLQQGKIVKVQSQKSFHKKTGRGQISRELMEQQNRNFQKNLLIGVNFCNKFYKNPSKLFEFYIQNIINENSIRNLIAGSLTTRRLFQESLQFSRIDSVRGNNHSTQELFNNKYTQNGSQNMQISRDHQLSEKSLKINKNKILEDRLRLEAIKKEIYDSIAKRNTQIKKKIINQNHQREIISKNMVGKTYYKTPERTLQKSRSRRRIFEESEKNLKLLRDFTPSKSEPNLTPFKAKMKNRIFDGSKSRARQDKVDYLGNTMNKSYQKQQVYLQNEQLTISPAVLKDFHNFQSGDSLSQHQSRGRESRGFSKTKESKLRNSQTRQKNQEESERDYHVSFENRNEMRRSNVSSNKYPSNASSHKNHQYVPINPNEERSRKKSSKPANNFISIEDECQSQQKKQVYRKVKGISVHGLYTKEKSQQSKGQIISESRQKFTPQSKFYLQKNQSDQFHVSIMGRNLQGNSIGNHVGTNQIKNEKKVQKIDENQKIKSSRQHLHKKEDQNQIKKINKDNQRDKNTMKKNLYNEDTFKQNEFSESPEIKKNDFNKKTAFKYSNQVYLDSYRETHSPSANNQPQNKRGVQSSFTNSSINKSTPMVSNDQKQRPRDGSSYLQKHKVKKSMQKQIEKSPDRHRCYGKSTNHPYLQSQVKYEKQPLYVNNNLSNNQQKQKQSTSKKGEVQYQNSPYKISVKQTPNAARGQPTKLF